MLRGILGASLAFFLSLGVHASDEITHAYAAELSLHRIERLVILRRLDASFQKNFARMIVDARTPQAPTDPAFYIRAHQSPGLDGTTRNVDLAFDQTGRALTHAVNSGAEPASPPAWPLKDPVTISENVLHWLEEEGQAVAELKPYLDRMTELEISPELDAQSALAGALVSIRIAAPGSARLDVRMALDGAFVSYALTPVAPPLEPSFASIRSRILVTRCLKCHGAGGEVERIPLDPLQALLDSPRELVIPGNSVDSGLLLALQRQDDKRMPPPAEGAPLSPAEISTIARWIDEGARP
jgi:hypothetical protein